MKKKHLLFAAMLFFSILPFTFFSSCDKDTNCYLDVLVIDEATRNPISGAEVDISQTGGNIKANGVTGKDGIHSFSFKVPAIVAIKATYKDTISGAMRYGSASVRLIEGERLTRTVTLPTLQNPTTKYTIHGI